jgi:hypothetical protein
LCNREAWEEWKQQKKSHGFHGSMITVVNRRFHSLTRTGPAKTRQ